MADGDDEDHHKIVIDEAEEALHVPFGGLTLHSKPGLWGPCGPYDEQFTDMPYQPFSKSDRLGKPADITGTYRGGRGNRYQSLFGPGDAYGYYHEEDESSFNLVNSSKTVSGPGMFKKRRWQPRASRRDVHRARDDRRLAGLGMQPLSKASINRDRARAREEKKWQRRTAGRHRMARRDVEERDPSVDVRSSWEILEELDLVKMQKLSTTASKPEDVVKCGAMDFYDKQFDRLSVRQERPLVSTRRAFHSVSTTDDPKIRDLVKSDATVFATDAILAAIMASPRSVYSWDLVIEKVRDKIFIDKRDDSAFDLLTVDETSFDPPKEDGSVNSPERLAVEATYINRFFSQMVTKHGAEQHTFPEPNPFAEKGENVASVGYRYRKWDLGDGIKVIARTEHDAVYKDKEGKTRFMNIKALNNWKTDPTMDWRQKLDSQRGAVLATELKNNAYKLAKWTISSLLAGSSQLRLGYVARVNPMDNEHHTVMGTQVFKPSEFATQINLSMQNCWGILKQLIELIKKYDAGKFVLIKDPNKAVLRLYSVPRGTFDEDESDSESEDEDDDDEDDEDDEA
eukprot:m.66767 g.66767  ORF g.66767 m.66767 type:complete len:569 (+) comp8385_c0_seq2:58-1764(+)